MRSDQVLRRQEEARAQGWSASADAYARYQESNSKGQLVPSKRQICFVTCDEAMRVRIRTHLQPIAGQNGYVCLAKPTLNDALNSAMVILDVRPKVDARMHAEYDKVLCIKKSMGKFGKDLLCLVGPRAAAGAYPRGTYGEIYLFCCDEKHPGRLEPDLTLDGLPQIGGPVLFNFAHMGEVLARWMSG